MKLAIKANKLADGSGFIAQVDWTKGDAGIVGTPGMVAYGDTALAAYQFLQKRLEAKGHTAAVAYDFHAAKAAIVNHIGY